MSEETDPMVVRPAPRPGPPPPSRSGWGLLLVITAAAMVVLSLSLGALWWALNRVDPGKVEAGTWAHVRLDGLLEDAPRDPGLFDRPDAVMATPTEIAAAIRRAAEDDRINGLFLDLGSVSGSSALVHELREAVDAFTADGKPCVAYADTVFTNNTYLLASACSTIAMHPSGVAVVDGLQIAVTYYRETLDKLGVAPEFAHVGDYKSAIEPFERMGPTPEAAEAYEGILDSLYEDLVGAIARGRGVDPSVARAWIDEPHMSPASLLDRGQIDALAMPETIKARVHRIPDEGVEVLASPLTDDDEPRLTRINEVVKGLRARSRRGPGVMVIHASGTIMPGDGRPGLFGDDGLLTDGKLVRWLDEARESDDVRAVVLRVDSPGGSGLASMNMRDAILRLKEAGKPVVVSMAGSAASGGYLISTDADWIVAGPTTITGSIGVFGQRFALDGLWEKLGMKTHRFRRGDQVGLMSTAPFSEAQRGTFQEYIASFYDEFIEVVAQGRRMEPESVEEHAQGRIWTGRQALDRGLVDQLGGLRDAVVKARELAELDADSAVYRLPRRYTFFERLMKEMDDKDAVFGRLMSSEIPSWLPARAAAEVELVVRDAMEGRVDVYAWLPGQLQVR